MGKTAEEKVAGDKHLRDRLLTRSYLQLCNSQLFTIMFYLQWIPFPRFG